MIIGITERGDAALNMSWTKKLHTVDGIIAITKNLTDEFIEKTTRLHKQNERIIVHATCTGWGGSYLEPNVPHPETQIHNIKRLIQKGFPESRIVLRIDPIIPTPEGLERVSRVIEMMREENLDLRIRISILDEYQHVKRRMLAHDCTPFYAPNQLYPTIIQINFTKQKLQAFAKKWNCTYELCAEKYLNGECFNHVGCVSIKDLEELDLADRCDVPTEINRQNRNGCLCLACKKEMLTQKHPCAHKCLYCYWKD